MAPGGEPMKQYTIVPAIVAIALGANASASVIAVVNGDKRTYRVTFMPDYDQRRAAAAGISGLGSSGSNFCATTSGTCLLSYIRQHGYALASMPDWQWSDRMTSSQYESVTNTIASIGVAMSTVPSGASAGTTATGWQAGMSANLPADCFTITQFVFTDTWAPTGGWLTSRLTNGTWGLPVVNICCGWYSPVSSGSTRLVRSGGHCMSLTKIASGNAAADREICFRDPWTDGTDSQTTQSAFVSGCFPYTSASYAVRSGSTDSTRVMSSIDGYGGLLDKAYIVEPVYGLTSDLTGQAVNLLRPVRFNFEPLASAVRQISMPGGIVLEDAVRDLYSQDIFAVTRQQTGTVGSLARLNTESGALVPVTLPGSSTDVVSVASGRYSEIFALSASGTSARDLIAISTDGLSETPIPPFIRPLPTTVEAIEYDDTTDRIVGLAPTARKLLTVARGANGAITSVDLPAAVSLSGKASLAIDQRTGQVFVTSSGSSAIWGLTLGASGQVESVETVSSSVIVSPEALRVDGIGQLVLATGGKTRVLKRTTQGWALNTGSPLSNLTVNGFLRIGVSRTNVPAGNPALAEREIVPPTATFQGVLDCVADLNLNKVVDGADLGIMLAVWGNQPSIGDLNQDGLTDGADLGIMLAAWGPCP
jgi:hypothetical protein